MLEYKTFIYFYNKIQKTNAYNIKAFVNGNGN